MISKLIAVISLVVVGCTAPQQASKQAGENEDTTPFQVTLDREKARLLKKILVVLSDNWHFTIARGSDESKISISFSTDKNHLGVILTSSLLQRPLSSSEAALVRKIVDDSVLKGQIERNIIKAVEEGLGTGVASVDTKSDLLSLLSSKENAEEKCLSLLRSADADSVVSFDVFVAGKPGQIDVQSIIFISSLLSAEGSVLWRSRKIYEVYRGSYWAPSIADASFDDLTRDDGTMLRAVLNSTLDLMVSEFLQEFHAR